MIFFISDGRLGNQLFQLAFLKQFAGNEETVFCFRMEAFTSLFEHPKKNIRVSKLGRVGFSIWRKLGKPLLKMLVDLGLIRYVKQKRNGHQSLPKVEIKNPRSRITFVETSFFQSEQFFANNPPEFKIRSSFIKEAKEILSSLPETSEKVFVHVRRGDYLDESYLGKKNIALPLSYYKQGIKVVKQKVENPFFIFLSDDIKYVKDHFKQERSSFFSNSSMQVDFALMTLCSHGIISNSSFSWWGSYMIKNKGIIISPKHWYGWKSKENSHLGIIPSFSEAIDVIEFQEEN